MLDPVWSRLGSTGRVRAFVAASAVGAVRPPARDRALQFGPDPIRVSFTGSGVAVGFGVEHREHALDGRVAALIGEATGRGVATMNRARGQARLSDQLLEAVMAGGFEQEDVLIWAPSLLQLGGRAVARQWRRQLDQLLTAAPTCRQTIVLAVPAPVGAHPIVPVAGPIVARINAALRSAADGHERVAVVSMPPMEVVEGQPLFTGSYYEQAAPAVATAILDGMDPSRRRCRIGATSR